MTGHVNKALLFLAIAAYIALSCFWLREPATEARFISGMKVHVWLPGQISGAPVIVFSHGFGGCAAQGAWLAEALAKAGFAVFAPDHVDAMCGNGMSRWHLEKPVSFETPEVWDENSYSYRRDDIQALLATLPQEPDYASLDWSRVGLVGHSLGGYAALAMGGALPQWQDARVVAVLALSPTVRPMLAQGGFKHIAVPVMYQGGTNDPLVTPYLAQANGAYDQTPAPKYLAVFQDAEHLSFTDLKPGIHEASAAYAVAFFNHIFRSTPFPPWQHDEAPKVQEFRSAFGVGGAR